MKEKSMRKYTISRLISIVFISIVFVLSCGPEKKDAEAEVKKTTVTPESQSETSVSPYPVAVFVPGVVSGSPTYEMLVAGAEKAAKQNGSIRLKVVEGGFNQSEWLDKVTALASSGDYSLIMTSNPAMPDICEDVAELYPNQRFLVLDGYLKGNPSIYTFLFNQMEQAYLIGHFAGLVTTSDLPGTRGDKKIGLIAGQEYPIMNEVIYPGFEQGLKDAAGGGSVDFRVLGNWFDATKASELANSIFSSGGDVILTIAGGANQGVVSAAEKAGTYVLWFDNNGYEVSPGTVLGCSALRLDRAAEEKLLAAAAGELPYGEAEIAGVKEEYVYFVDDDPAYREHVPEEIREKQAAVIEEIKTGEISLSMPMEE
jgi:riboflavin transport system substrate-binding protein